MKYRFLRAILVGSIGGFVIGSAVAGALWFGVLQSVVLP